MAKEKEKKDPDLIPLRAMVLGTAFLLDFYKASKNAKNQIKDLKDMVAEQKQKIFEMGVLLKGYEAHHTLRIEVCAKCFGAGAFMIKEEVEECDECDGDGWKLKPKKD